MATLRTPSGDRRPTTEQLVVDMMHDATLAVRARLQTELLPAKLTVNQFWLLHRILDEGSTTTGRLATLEGLTAGTVSVTVDQLVRDGLVLRKPAEGDRRLVTLVASPEGEARVRGVWQRLGETFQAVGRTIPRSDFEAMVRVVGALRAASGTGRSPLAGGKGA
jgi:DNA-binding MarR family transcriptional regulator